MLKITFKTNYKTIWGQRMMILGNIPALGDGDIFKGILLEYSVGDVWSKTLDIPLGDFEYEYVLVDDNFRILDREDGEKRAFVAEKKLPKRITLKDAWRSKLHPENALNNAAFLNVIFKQKTHKTPKVKRSKYQSLLHFRINVPRVEAHQRICILGNIPALGSWDETKPLLLGNENYPSWSAVIPFVSGINIEYKYGIYDIENKVILFLENGENRKLYTQAFSGQQLNIITDNYFQYPESSWKGAGVAIPVFALRSKQGFGIGEFTDIKLLVDWAQNVGMKMVQILPINDTSATNTWVDSYPYAAISVFALHPMYLNLEKLKEFGKVIDKKEYKKLKNELNALKTVDYEAVNHHKLAFARQIYDKGKSDFLNSKKFKKFLENNQYWLKPYAYFCTLRDKFGTTDFEQWGENKTFLQYKMSVATEEGSESFDDIAFYYYLQYHLDAQLKEVTTYARTHQIILKGDIPIGIYRYSVDAWTQPHLYHMDAQAGAPPDPFSEIGQNWGFPTYNWETMAIDGYAWWQNRLRTLSKYFDAFRIDHILGFFRIWQVPYTQIEATLGYFYPAIPVTLEEFEHRGIPFNYQRYCKPFISNHLLEQWFGEYSDYIRNTFLEMGDYGDWSFKSEFDSQRKVRAFFQRKENQHLQKLESILFKVHSNVLFIEESGSEGRAFHPRFEIFKTHSYLCLHAQLQGAVYELYMDYFYNRQNDFWAASAMRKLPAIKSATNMLICGEDLGMIPDCVAPIMQNLNILTLEIQRMSKNPNTDFLQAVDTPYYSVSSPSTHDMSPLRLWWQESDREYIQRFYEKELSKEGNAPEECTTEIAKEIIVQHLDLPSMWTVFPIADLLSMDESLRHPNPEAERINEPSNPQHYWRYRLHIALEDLLVADDFNDDLNNLLRNSDR